MKKLAYLALTAAGAACALSGPARASDPNGAAGSAVLRWGTPVMLDTTREISSADAMLGQRIALQVADDVVVDGHVVIAKGSPAVGEVSAVTGKGSWGQRGRLGLRLLYARAGDRMVRISGDLGKQGHNGTAGAAAAVVAFGVAGGFLVTGTSAVVPPGTGFTAYVDEDVPLVFGDAAMRPVAYGPRDAPALVTASAP